MILNFPTFVFYHIRNSTSFIISYTVIISNGFYPNKIPPVLWIICLTCFFLSQLKYNCKEHLGRECTVCNWFTGEFKLCCWPKNPSAISLLLSYSLAPQACSLLHWGTALSSMFPFILSQGARSFLCCQPPPLRHSTPPHSWSWTAWKWCNTTTLVRHTLIPGYPQMSRKPLLNSRICFTDIPPENCQFSVKFYSTKLQQED
jgi:hypothetical protein